MLRSMILWFMFAGIMTIVGSRIVSHVDATSQAHQDRTAAAIDAATR